MAGVPHQDVPFTNPPPTGLPDPPRLQPLSIPEEEIDYDSIVIEDGKPVDSVHAERQMKLLTEPLHTSWNPGVPFMALANVGMFYEPKKPPLVPDVMVSLVVRPGDPKKKKNKSYFIWVMGKPPDIVFEHVSNTEGEELGEKLAAYPKHGVPYYIVFDPDHFLGEKTLHCFVNRGGVFEPCDPWFPAVGLGVALWTADYMNWEEVYLRWTDAQGNFIPTGDEKAELERQRAEKERTLAEQERQRAEKERTLAEQERQRAEQEKQRAEKERTLADQERQRAESLAAKLRALGIDPDQPS